ncbi:hypothetical protein RF679_11410 [Undibacterium cyanobacteriorum]|uniref:Glycosyltransferase n=1 Tax=Undibacterium cyanobacteriorum TaxID=3073561 RepID=A0ABY9RG27_9BURK|nr:hypothetical protein [Undibacterium sp. 20NA77.5]WMW79255.1 hypothetical protein RF679_11410 [Undibacterium sp. 20NA77.5]
MLNQFLLTSQDIIKNAARLDDAIRAARFLGELCWKNSIGCYQLIDLENHLAERFAAEFEMQAKQILAQAQTKTKIPYVHVLTKAYDTGGHTKVVERFIASQALRASAVVVTEKAQANCQLRLAKAAHGLHTFPAKLSPHAKITRLLEHFANAETVVLHIHPNDIETALAALLARRWFGTSIFFYNHADHVFSYGYASADQVLELSYFGWTLAQRRGTDSKAHFVGIPLNLPEVASAVPTKEQSAQSEHAQEKQLANNSNEQKRTAYLASSGSPYKFKPSQGFSFPQVALELCQKSGLAMTLVGPHPWRDWWWWKPRLSLGQSLRFTGKLQYQDYLDCITHATAYIDSFPMTGGTSFSEILCQGVPCFGILTGAHGYSPADQLKSADQTSMIQDVLRHLDHPQVVREKIAQLQHEVRQAHALEIVAGRIVHLKNHPQDRQAPPWRNPVPVDTTFYEKIWQSQTLFSPPVHSRPDWKIGIAFLRLWWNKKKLG